MKEGENHKQPRTDSNRCSKNQDCRTALWLTSTPATYSTAPCGFLVAGVRLELTVFRV